MARLTTAGVVWAAVMLGFAALGVDVRGQDLPPTCPYPPPKTPPSGLVKISSMQNQTLKVAIRGSDVVLVPDDVTDLRQSWISVPEKVTDLEGRYAFALWNYATNKVLVSVPGPRSSGDFAPLRLADYKPCASNVATLWTKPEKPTGAFREIGPFGNNGNVIGTNGAAKDGAPVGLFRRQAPGRRNAMWMISLVP